MITKTPDALTGTRYVIEGGAEKANEEVGAPTGTTFLVRNLFYNTPARQKFLKTPVTEANAVTSVVEQLALSHPGISFKYMVNSQVKLHTSGNRNLKELVYNIYGRDIAPGADRDSLGKPADDDRRLYRKTGDLEGKPEF